MIENCEEKMQVVEALRDAKRFGSPFLYRSAIEEVTRLGPARVRHLCDTLKTEGVLTQGGVGRGARYSLVGSP